MSNPPTRRQKLSTAYMKGLRASKQGYGLDACPYRKAYLRLKWQVGWYDGPRKSLMEQNEDGE